MGQKWDVYDEYGIFGIKTISVEQKEGSKIPFSRKILTAWCFLPRSNKLGTVSSDLNLLQFHNMMLVDLVWL